MKQIPFIYLLCMISIPVLPQDPGDLYMPFGQDGVYTAAKEDTSSSFSVAGVLSDGSLIASGTYYVLGSGVTNVAVLKLNNQGDVMPFGNSANGFEYQLSEDNIVSALCILPDDRILVSVRSYETYEHPHLIMLDPDGEPVTGFGENGIFTDPRTMYVHDIGYFQHAGETYIIMCGGCLDFHPVFMMIDHTGELVSSFGDNGMYTLTSVEGTFGDLVIDHHSGQMYVSGTSSSSSDCTVFLVKYELPGGYRNTGFGVDGILCFSEESGYACNIRSIVYEEGNHTLTALGYYPHPEGDWDIFAYRMNGEDGTADDSFGINGWSALRVPVSNDYITSALVQPDGKYCFGGHTDYHGNLDFLIGRITAGGLLDASFGNNGVLTTEIYPGKNNRVTAIVSSPDRDMLYVAGSTDTPDEYAMAVAAYHTGYESGPGLEVQENIPGTVEIFPNPVKDQIRIHTGQSGLHHVLVFDITGKVCYHEPFTGEVAELYLKFLNPGVYFIQITLPDRQISTCRLLKQ